MEATAAAPEESIAGEEALYSVTGMWCTSCALAIEAELRRRAGVAEARVNYATATLWVRGTAEGIAQDGLARQLERLDYGVVPLAEVASAEARLETESRLLVMRLLVAMSFGMWTLLASLLIYVDAMGDARLDRILALVSGAFALPVVVYAARPFYRAAWRTLLARRPGMDVLVSLGVLGAMLVSLWLLWQGVVDVYFDTAVMLVTLLLAGRLVETLARYKGLRALGNLYTPPDSVTRLEAGRWVEVPRSTVTHGDRLRVDTQDTVPLDGTLIDAEARLDLSSVSGESRPQHRTRGDALTAGCRNLGPPLTLEVTAVDGEGYLDRLQRRTLELHARKQGLQRLADRFAAWLSPLAMVLSGLVLAVLLLTGLPPEEAFVRALSVLVVACPCAVGLAIPMVLLSASDRAVAQGIAFRDLTALESAGQARAVAFDKTGTLTETGSVTLTAMEAAEGVDASGLLTWAARLEATSEHPLARAIRQAAWQRGLLADDSETMLEGAPGAFRDSDAIKDVAGAGREWQEGGETWRIGRSDWLSACGIEVPALEGSPHLEVHVACGHRWLGRLLLDDSTAPGAAFQLQRLRDQGLTLAMISGDRPDRVRELASRVGLATDECFAGQTPEGKARLVAALPKPNVFVGDGINDVLALATAEVGIAPYQATSQARDSAAIQLLKPGLDGVVQALALARRARRIMRQNLVLSVLYNALALGIVVAMPIPPLVAVLAMAFSSLSVVGNAARLSLGKAAPIQSDGDMPQLGASRAPLHQP
ncbi:heavy metal translocating P-type ATPase [Litchfieldella xinjiangensis]|uniref:heavy metal translocating P-type ATPase n=1 Tax=Litchfieldella xinjiangensis TaxID=1166948 RepID=UPI000AC40E88|nr:cation-translocating P-type ATPase [Halomonas xinjiangensis]